MQVGGGAVSALWGCYRRTFFLGGGVCVGGGGLLGQKLGTAAFMEVLEDNGDMQVRVGL
jgi:hypothetical protein